MGKTIRHYLDGICLKYIVQVVEFPREKMNVHSLYRKVSKELSLFIERFILAYVALHIPVSVIVLSHYN